MRIIAKNVTKGAVKKQKKRLNPEKIKDAVFLWYNVIVKKQTPQEHYTAYQLKLPVEIEKIIEISDPVYIFSAMIAAAVHTRKNAASARETGSSV